MTKKIIHLSDLHIGYEKQDLTFRAQEIMKNMISRITNPEDHVVAITGDLIQDANREQNWYFSEEILTLLKSHFPHVLVVPGNHDYGTGASGNKQFVRKFKEHYFNNADITYPKKDIIDNIAFIGLDSMASELHFYDKLGANGELGKGQRKRLDAMLAQSDVMACEYRVVYLHHHPFAPQPMHGLKDASKLGDILMEHNNVNAILFGHNHNFKMWYEWGIRRCYDAGSSTRKKDEFSLHRIIDLSRAPVYDEAVSFFGRTI